MTFVHVRVPHLELEEFPMTHQDFVKARLVEMLERPLCWGSTRESFGLQLMMLVDFYEMQVPATFKTPTYSSMQKLFGPGPTSSFKEPLDEIWADGAVRAIRLILKIY